MILTPEQFDALQSWVVAEIEARAVRNSAGPHVKPTQDAAKALSLIARYHLTGESRGLLREILKGEDR